MCFCYNDYKSGCIIMCYIDKLKNQIVCLVEKQKYIKISSITSKDHGIKTTYKQGLYFLYEDSNQPVYIGKIGDFKNTSLYSRLIGHGSGAHNKEFWFKAIKKCKFKSITGLDNKQLFQIERLAISAKNPKYNDTKVSIDEAQDIISIIPPLYKVIIFIRVPRRGSFNL